MVTSNTLPGWFPATPTIFKQPVLVESAVGGLCGAALPGGGGCLVWPNGGAAKFAVTASPEDFLEDNIVPAVDIGVIVAGDVRAVSVYVIGGVLYATVVTFSGSTTTTKIYQANNPDGPTSWSPVATLQNDNTPGALFGMQTWGACIPLQLASGRWVAVQGCWQFGLVGGAASGANGAAWYSDDGAAGPWILTNQYRHPYFNFSEIEWCSAQVAQDPVTGYLYYTTATGAGGPDYGTVLWESQDEALTWGLHGTGAWDTFHLLSASIDNGQQVFAFGGSPGGVDQWSDVFVRTGDAHDTNRFSGGWTDTGQNWFTTSYGFENTHKAIVAQRAVYSFVRDRVHRHGATGWTIDAVGI
jgi:hypothetical protein